MGPFMRPSRLQTSLERVFGPAAPPSQGFLRTAYAALTFNGGHLILHQCVPVTCIMDLGLDLDFVIMPLSLLLAHALPCAGQTLCKTSTLNPTW